MAILTFEDGFGVLEGFGLRHRLLRYKEPLSLDASYIAASEALAKIKRINGIQPEEAGPLASFLMEGLALSEFRNRTSPEDFAVLLDAVVTEGEAVEKV